MKSIDIAVEFKTNKIKNVTLCVPVGIVPGHENNKGNLFISVLTGEVLPKTNFVVNSDDTHAYNLVRTCYEPPYTLWDSINEKVYYHDPTYSPELQSSSVEEFYNSYGIVVGKKETTEEHNARITDYIDSFKDHTYVMSSPDEK